ncbi:hypothetical protein BT67DRAFT_459218 [Trichocladium antarcticum]|uniref:Ras modification protein ERF4 n=1 Tax=Trichocladium antarcticum TaxID=1450529 RepID=A0AAN6USS6_9PEZI|nr:hypothetical protein BT67DRAFT_459218 [Trichocladium antarcticum]
MQPSRIGRPQSPIRSLPSEPTFISAFSLHAPAFPTPEPSNKTKTPAHPAHPQPAKLSALDASAEPRLSPAASPNKPSSSQHPPAPGRPSRRNSLLRRGLGAAPDSFLQSPFRTRLAATPFNTGPFQPPLQNLSAARLWNPTNSTPRTLAPPPDTAHRRRRLSTPPPPPIPVSRPTLGGTADPADPIGSAGDFPLLTLPEQHQDRRARSNRPSLHLDQRISLPPSLRHSYDGKRASPTPSPAEAAEAGPSFRQPAAHLVVPEGQRFRSRGLSFTKLQAPVGLSFRPGSRHKEGKGKGKEVMVQSEDAGDRFSADLERGPDARNQPMSMASRLSGIGSEVSSSNSSIMGDPDQPPDNGDEWGPQHPCYPHLNPHVPVDSREYATTRIIRVRRDWLVEGDLAPTFSNLYPDILDPAGVSEHDFRRLIDKLNSELVPIFSPYDWRNIVDNVLGAATGWLWDDLGFTAAKTRLRRLDKWIAQWNAEMEKTAGADEGGITPRIVPLKRTGYMTLDIQIPDPELAPASPTTAGPSRDGPPFPMEPHAAVTA